MEVSRRDFLRLSVAAGTGTALSGLVGSGVNLTPTVARAQELRIKGAKTTPSLCPYCSVGCATLVSTIDGKIVNIASINAIRSLPAIAIAYAASKAAVIALTREVAVQYAAKGIRANAILPGLMDTPMVIAQLTSAYGGDVEEMLRRRARLCPTGKQGDAWDTAHAALFLASDESKYITGTTLVVDGGLTSTLG